MTVIRLDAATLAALKTGGIVYLAGENGEPVLECRTYPVGQQPKYTTEEAIVHAQGGRRLTEDELDRLIEHVRILAGEGPEATDEEMDAMIRNDR